MPRDILSEYGPDLPEHKESLPHSGLTTNGGRPYTRDVHNYSPPVGPSNINESKTPGLHGENHGVCGTQGKH